MGKMLIEVGDNKTADGFWFSCSYNALRLKYEEGKVYNLHEIFSDIIILPTRLSQKITVFLVFFFHSYELIGNRLMCYDFRSSMHSR